MAEVRVAGTDDVAEGEMKAFDADGRSIVVARDSGQLYAFENECSHRHCALDDGDLEDGQVVCACHGSAFNLETGEPTNPPATEPIATYPVREEGDGIIVALD